MSSLNWKTLKLERESSRAVKKLAKNGGNATKGTSKKVVGEGTTSSASPNPATEPAQTRSSARRRLLDAAPGLNKSVKVSDPLDTKDTKRRLNFGDRAVAKKRLKQRE